MIPFTLFCFAKVFNLSYSGGSSWLIHFFDQDRFSSESLSKVVYGITDGHKYAARIDMNNQYAVQTLRSVSADRLKYTYLRIMKENPDGKSKEELFSSLLEHALLRDKKTQADVFSKKDSIEVRTFIAELRDMTPVSDTALICSETEISHDENTASVSSDPIDSGQVKDADFLRFIEEHIDEVSSFLICCHISANWLKPSSPRFHLLRSLCERNVRVRVIINTSEAISEIYPHMVDREAFELKMYQTPDQVTETWKTFSASRPSMTVRRLSIPLLHTLTVCEFHSGLQPIMRTTLYAYGNPLLEDHPHLVFSKGDAYFDVLRNEFEYLWDRAEPAE